MGRLIGAGPGTGLHAVGAQVLPAVAAVVPRHILPSVLPPDVADQQPHRPAFAPAGEPGHPRRRGEATTDQQVAVGMVFQEPLDAVSRLTHEPLQGVGGRGGLEGAGVPQGPAQASGAGRGAGRGQPELVVQGQSRGRGGTPRTEARRECR